MKRSVLSRKFGAYLFLLPWLCILLIFTLYPFVEGIRMSLYDFSLREQTFIGLENFRQLFSDGTFWRSLRVTFHMCAFIIPGTLVFSLTVAYAIQDLPGLWKSFFKIVFYLSAIVSQVALVMVWKWMFNPSYGWYKTLCREMGMAELNLLGDSTYSVPLIAILVLTFTVSQPIVLFSAAIDGIPQSYFEACQLDGAGRFTQFRKVTMPQISHVLLLVTVTTTINNLQVFVVPQLLTGGGPNGQTTPVLLQIYNTAFEYGKYGYASAMGVILFAVIGAFVAVQFLLRREEGAS